MVVNLRRGAPVSAGTTLPSAGGLLRDPSCSQLDPSRTLPMESCCPGVKSCVQSVGAAPKKKKKKKKAVLVLHELLCSSFPVSEASGSERFCSVCIKVLLEVAADGKSASVAVSFVSCPAVNEPFVLSKPIRLKVSDPLLDFSSSASFI